MPVDALLRRSFCALLLFALCYAPGAPTVASDDDQEPVLRAGAYAIDVTPEEFPVLVNGGMYSRTADRIVDRLHARCLVLDDGKNKIAIVVVDSCMLPRDLLDDAKELASRATQIPMDRMLISATHTHSAPATMGGLGTDADKKYAAFLPARIARGIQLAHDNLEPARIGWGKSRDPENVYCRRFLMKEGTAATNPFSGKTNDRAQMNPGHNNPNAIRRTGPVDDQVFVVAVQAKDGRPIALLANYSTHYAGAPSLSADYFGVFAEKIAQELEVADPDKKHPPFVAMMSNGTSGDANCIDFTRGDPRKFDRFTVAEGTAAAAMRAYKKIKYFDWAPIVMAEGLLTLNVRMPTDEEVAKAKSFLQTDEGKKLRSIPAVYARETVILSEMPPMRELKLQAIRIGPLGITAIPNEVYGSTGLAIKKDSPLESTFNIELANGAEGYIPPPDQHKLGGYTTWRARTSCLEEGAEPKIRAKLMGLLKEVATVERVSRPAQKSPSNKSPIGAQTRPAAFRAGAYAIDITPTKFPVIVNGMFTERTANKAHDKLHARCLVLDDGDERIAIAVVDSLMMPRELIDEAKQLASKTTGISVNRIMISATHTHSAPSVMGCLGSRADPEYPAQLAPAIARGITLAAKNLTPAKLGYAVAEAGELTHCRRWLRRPDAVGGDPFGVPTVRAMMHPGYQNPSYVGPAGPVDPDLTLVAIQTIDGKPLAVLANYSMHYFGSPLVSADYFGLFCEKLGKKIAPKDQTIPFVGILSQGTSGDLHWMDYAQPQKRITLDEYSQQLADIAAGAYAKIEYRSDISLAMAETNLKFRRRTPNEKRLAWAKEIVEKLGDRLPQSQPEIYAREAIYLHEEPQRELVLQAIRLGEVGIATFPNEVFGITGMKIKRQSPLACTFNIELANGAEGYIPPPEQHRLGGYSTWPARTAGLEIEAEPKIVAALLTLLEEASGEKRTTPPPASSKYQDAVLASKPVGYWPLDDLDAFEVSHADDGLPAKLEGGAALYLEGVSFPSATPNRAVQFAGGRLVPQGAKLGEAYSVAFWLENRLPNDLRAITAYLFSRGPDGEEDCPGDHLGIMGTHDAENTGRLIFFNGNKREQVADGKTVIAPYTWNHVAMVREASRVRVYLNGALEIDAEIEPSIHPDVQQIFFAGRSDNFANLAGKLDEVALFDRALSADEIAAHFTAAEVEIATTNASHDVGDSAEIPSPVSPEDSLKYLHVRPGMKVELVAAEPLVRDPVAFDWGPDGKLWVVEYLDYPTGIDGKGTGGGRIVFLEDNNQDGMYDKSTLFIDKLNFPTGVMAWRNGILITAAPDILYAEDNDNDGRADKIEKLYTGFHEANQQLRVNGLRWGLDNWIYCASGSHHGDYGKESRIKSTKTGETVHIGARDFRIKPDEGLIEPVSGPSQFGRNRDPWGNWFGTQNAKPMFHYVLDDRYLRRNPHVAPPPSQVLISDVPGQRPVFPRSKPGKFHHASQAGRFTSANSAMIYGDELLGKEFIGNSFVSEPVHNLVHREIVERDGVTFKSHKPKDEENAEFLASEDTWFRPTTIRTGPDGALWIADMYREIIEHPHWVSDDLKPIVDTRSGTDRGRIYRIYPEGAKLRVVPRVRKLHPNELLELIANPNATLRDMAHMRMVTMERPLFFKQELNRLATRGILPTTRIQALCAAEGLPGLRAGPVSSATFDEDPWVRREALRLIESRPQSNRASVLIEHERYEPDPAVRLQLAFALGESNSPETARALARLFIKDGKHPLIVAAAFSSVNKDNIAAVLEQLFNATGTSDPPGDIVGRLVALAVDFEQVDAVDSALARMLRAEDGDYAVWQVGAAEALLVSANAPFDNWSRLLPDGGKEAQRGMATMLEWSATRSADDDCDPATRARCVCLLGFDSTSRDKVATLLADLLSPRTPATVQSAAIDSLVRLAHPNTPITLLRDWNSHGPQLRSQILDAILSRGPWTNALLTSIEKGEVSAADIDASRRERLLKSKSAEIRERAAKLFTGGVDEDRAKVIAAYQPTIQSLLSDGDLERGRVVFKDRCSACHKLDGVGNDVGPNLQGLTDKSPGHLLTSILDPNRAVEPKYVSYQAVTEQGRIYNGMLADESGGSLTLLDAEGKRHVILRRDLEELTASGKSLMPEGLEKDIDQTAMRDLLRYLQSSLSDD